MQQQSYLSYKPLLVGLCLFLGSVFLISCSSSSSDEDTTTSLVTSSYEDLTTKLDELGSLSPDPESTASIFSFLESPLYAAAIATHWDSTDTIGLVDPEGGATPISIFDYLSIQFDPESERENDSATNVFGRIDDALSIFCAIGHGVDDLDDDGYPEIGDHTITLTDTLLDTWETDCDITFDSSVSYVDQSITLSVSTATDTTYFDLSITADTPFGTDPFYFYVRYTDSDINVATTEKEDSDQESRTSVLYDLDEDTFRAEYISTPADSGEDAVYMYRLHMDGSTAHVATWESGDDSMYRTYAAAGDMDDDSITCSISFSVSADYNASSSSDYSNLNGCVNRNTGSIHTDDSLACDVPLDGVAEASTVSNLVNTTILLNKSKTGWNTIDLSTASITFTTAAEMFSQAPETP